MKSQKSKIVPRNNLSKHEWIKLYFTQTEFLSEIYHSGQFTDDELLYFFPNNKLKRLGFPMKRGGKNKKYKKLRIHNTHFFNIIDETIKEKLCNYQYQKEFFDKFVTVKDLEL